MKNFILLLITGILLFCSGCFRETITDPHAFYSTKSPSITIKFNDQMNYIGQDHGTDGCVNRQTYYYANSDKDNNLKKLSFIDDVKVSSGYEWYPKYLPAGDRANTSVFTKEIDGSKYYCRMYLSSKAAGNYITSFYEGKNYTFPKELVALTCVTLSSKKRKTGFTYMEKADSKYVSNLFDESGPDSGYFTDAQMDFWKKAEKDITSEILAKKFEESDLK